MMAALTIPTAIAVELLLSLPSHPKCSTLYEDGPCGYLDRVAWNLSNGSWGLDIALAVTLIMAVWLLGKKLIKVLR